MKRVIFLFGGSGGRMAEALVLTACAGILPEEELHIVLCDPQTDGAHGTAQLRQELTDYQRLWASRTYVNDDAAPFRAEITLRTWCDPLPMNAKCLRDWTRDNDQNRLLCQALFSSDTADLDLRQGFHDHPELARIAFAALLNECRTDGDDAMSREIAEISKALEDGEEVRVALAGSLCGGTGAAGLESVSSFLKERFGMHPLFRMGAALLLPCAEDESPLRARQSLARIAQQHLLDTVCLIGLPQSAQASGGGDLPRLTDWLGAYCLDMMLHRPTWLSGTFTIQSLSGKADWSLFGKAADRYRTGFGALVKGALLWQRKLLPELHKQLTKDNALRSGLSGWYPHFFRGATEDLEDVRADADAIDRLTAVTLRWIAGVVRSLPLDLRYASSLEAVRAESAAHYNELIKRAGELAVLHFDAERSGINEDEGIQRTAAVDPDLEAFRKRVSQLEQEIRNEESVQLTYNRQMGGQAALQMVLDALKQAESENTRLLHDHAEALRRIEQAEAIVKPSERFRIDDARTKLVRFERHQRMVEGMCTMLRRHAKEMQAAQTRFDKPSLLAAEPENGLFLQGAADRWIRDEAESAYELADWFPHLVCGATTVSLPSALRALRQAPKEKEAPAVWLLICAMEASILEENK